MSPSSSGPAVRVPIPVTRDPFVNTQLLPLGVDGTGEEAFWISSYNARSGCTGVVVTASGQARLINFPQRYAGFYAAAVADRHTVWLADQLSRVVRLDLSTDTWIEHETGAPDALVFQGLVRDAATGKTFTTAFPVPRTWAVSFDPATGESVQYPDSCPDRYACTSFTNGDGTHSMLVFNPGLSVLRWDPVAEAVTRVDVDGLAPAPHPQLRVDGIGQVIRDEDGHAYLPGRGWYDPMTTALHDGPRPEREATWFGRRGAQAWGMDDDLLLRWDLASGTVTELTRLTDSHFRHAALTADGDVVSVSRYGYFRRVDGQTGAITADAVLPTDAVGEVDCVRRIDEHRLLGTPFISQRFWVIDLPTKRGHDLGRAAAGDGEILQTWNVGGTIYQAAYTTGELTAYHPDRPAGYPDNPRPVTTPPGAMRPVASAAIGPILYYGCTRRYGLLGGTITRVDTRTGAALHRDGPLPDQALTSLQVDAQRGWLLGGTTVDADGRGVPPTAGSAALVTIDPDSLEVRQQADVAARAVRVVGPVDAGRWLVLLDGVAGDTGADARQWAVVDAGTLAVEAAGPYRDLGAPTFLEPTGCLGRFVGLAAGRVVAYAGIPLRETAVLIDDPDVYRCWADEHSVYAATPRELIVLDNPFAEPDSAPSPQEES